MTKFSAEAKKPEDLGLKPSILLFLVVFCVAVLSPAVVFAFSLTKFVNAGDYTNAAILSVAGITFALPTYLSERYSNRWFGTPMRLAFSWVAPVCFILAICPDSEDDIALKLCLASLAVVKFALARYRRSCRSNTTKQEKLKILICGDAFPPKVDGVCTFAMQSVELLQSFGHTVHIVTSIKGAATIGGAQVTRVSGFKTGMCAVHTVSIPDPSLLLTLRDVKPDVVHLFEISLLSIFMVFYCWVADIPVVMSHHTRIDLYLHLVSPIFPDWFNQTVIYLIQQVFYPLIDVNMAVCDWLCNRIRGLNGNDVRLWSSGVDPKFDPKHFSHEMRNILSNGKPEVPLVIHVGRLGLEKNSEEIPEMVRKTREILGAENIRFAIIGDGVIRKEIEEECNGGAEKGDYDHQVKYMGILRGQDLLSAYASSDVFFGPSVTDTFPLVYLEAMASGLAVAGPRGGGVPDTFTNGVHGMSFKAHDTDDAAKAIAEVLNNLKSMKAKAAVHGKKFTWLRVVRELDQAIKDVYERKKTIVHDNPIVDKFLTIGNPHCVPLRY